MLLGETDPFNVFIQQAFPELLCTLGTGLAPGDTYMTMTDQLLVGEKGEKQANK